MKTMQKTIALTVTVLFSCFAFSQVNLGSKATTQAVTNASVSTNALKVRPVINTAGQATKAAVSTTTGTGAAVKTNIVATANTTTKKTVATTSEVKNDVKSSADINAT